MLFQIIRLCLLAMALLLSVPSLAASPIYTVAQLPTPGGLYSSGSALNSSGQVTGQSNSQAFLYSNGVTIGLGGDYSYGYDINNSGQVTGSSYFSGNLTAHAFLYRNGSLKDLGSLGGGQGFGPGQSYGLGINDSGQITGYSDLAAPPKPFHAFLYSNGVMTDLGTLGGSQSRGFGINNSGQVTGDSLLASGLSHAFLYSNGTMTDLGTLGGAKSVGYALNSRGQVTGESYLAGTAGFPHAFLYNNGVMTDLGTLGGLYSSGSAINNGGQVTGASYVSGNSGPLHAFLYSDGSMKDLNDLIDPALNLVLTHASGINDSGQIIADGEVGGSNPVDGRYIFSRSYLLTPITTTTPEPASVALCGAALLSVGLWRWYRC